MDLKYRVILSDKAKSDIKKIIDGILEISQSAASAKRWYDLIIKKAEALAIFPEGHARFLGGERVFSVHIGKYRVIYEVLKKDRVVCILRVIYARRALGRVRLR